METLNTTLQFCEPRIAHHDGDTKSYSIQRITVSPLHVFDDRQHHLFINMGAPITMSDGSICYTGNIFSAGQHDFSNSSFKGTCDTLHIGIDKVFADRVLDVNRFRLRTTTNTHDPFIEDVAQKLSNLSEQKSNDERVYIEGLIIATIIHLAHEYHDAVAALIPKGKLRARQLVEVIEFTRSCMHHNVTLEEMAAVVHLSPYHFGRLFKQTVGLSPYQFVLQQKIEYAKMLMRQQTRPIGDIAYQLNFSDQAHFSNAFRKATGISPRSYVSLVRAS